MISAAPLVACLHSSTIASRPLRQQDGQIQQGPHQYSRAIRPAVQSSLLEESVALMQRIRGPRSWISATVNTNLSDINVLA